MKDEFLYRPCEDNLLEWIIWTFVGFTWLRLGVDMNFGGDFGSFVWSFLDNLCLRDWSNLTWLGAIV